MSISEALRRSYLGHVVRISVVRNVFEYFLLLLFLQVVIGLLEVNFVNIRHLGIFSRNYIFNGKRITFDLVKVIHVIILDLLQFVQRSVCRVLLVTGRLVCCAHSRRCLHAGNRGLGTRVDLSGHVHDMILAGQRRRKYMASLRNKEVLW